EPVCGVCHDHDARVFGGPNPAAMLCLIPSGLGQTGEQTPGVGAHAGVVLWLSPRVHARVVGGSLVRLCEASATLDYGYFVIPTCFSDVALRASGDPHSSLASSASITKWPCLYRPIAPLLCAIR